jgi:hypothetical protein
VPMSAPLDWTTNEHGHFLPRPPKSHRRVLGAVNELVNRIQPGSFTALFLRGSAATQYSLKGVFDIDLVFVISEGQSRRLLRNEARIAWSRIASKGLPSLDLGLASVRRLVEETPNLTQMLLRYDGYRVIGKDIFENARPITASRGLGKDLLRAHLAGTSRVIKEFEERSVSIPRQWIEKRICRVGGPLSLMRGGPFSRNPARCSQLFTEEFPEAAPQIDECLMSLLAEGGTDDNGSSWLSLWADTSNLINRKFR